MKVDQRMTFLFAHICYNNLLVLSIFSLDVIAIKKHSYQVFQDNNNL